MNLWGKTMDILTEKFEEKVIDVVKKAIKCVVSVSVKGKGEGSGVILSEDGYIVTNAHVAEGAEHMNITLHDNCTLDAKVVGRSNIRDIAILKTDAHNLDYLKIAKSADLEIGQFCIAIGNSLGLGTTVTFGMVSGLNRSIPDQRLVSDGLLQTSAPINPGNSGGALVDLRGNLIGVPTAMIMFASGVGFAIASDDVQDLYCRLLETGTLRAPQLGMTTKTVDANLAKNLGLIAQRGAVVLKVWKGPAMAAGLQPSDVIVEIDDTKVFCMEDLRNHVIRKRLGDRTTLKYVRGAATCQVDIIL